MVPLHNYEPNRRDSDDDSDGESATIAAGSRLRVGELRIHVDSLEGDIAEVNITNSNGDSNANNNVGSVEVISAPDQNGHFPDNLVVAYNGQNENGDEYVQYEHYEVVGNLDDYPELHHLLNADAENEHDDGIHPVIYDLLMQTQNVHDEQNDNHSNEQDDNEQSEDDAHDEHDMHSDDSDNEDNNASSDDNYYESNDEHSDENREVSDNEYEDSEEEDRRDRYSNEFRNYLSEYESIRPNHYVDTSNSPVEYDPYQTQQFDRFLPTLGYKCDVYTIISIVFNVAMLVGATIFIPLGINRLTQNGCDGNLNVNKMFQQIDEQGIILNQNIPLGHLRFALRSSGNFNAIAVTGPNGVGKSMFVEVLQDNFPWPQNMRSYAWNTDVSDDNVKLDVIRLMINRMSKCGINLLVIRNLGPCNYDIMMRIKAMVQDTKGMEAKRVLLVFVVNVPVSESKNYCNQHLQNMKPYSNISFVTFNTFGEPELYDCIWQEARIRKLDLNDADVKKIASGINVFKTGCHEKRFPADNFAEWNNGHPLGLRTVHAYVLVYDMGNLETFQYCRAMREQILDSFSHRDFSIIVVGNKYDTISTEAQANSQELKDISTLVRKHWRCGYVECSAQFNYKIGDVFRELMGCTSSGSAVGTEYTQSNRNKGRCTIL